MSAYRLAQLTDQQLARIEALENDLGVTLVAWEPADEAGVDGEELQGYHGERSPQGRPL